MEGNTEMSHTIQNIQKRPLYRKKRFWLGAIFTLLFMCILGILAYYGAMWQIFNNPFYLIDGRRVWHFEVVNEEYRLGGWGFQSIGIGSTRQQVEADFRRRMVANRAWADCGCSRMRLLHEHDLPPYSGFGYYIGYGPAVAFEFDEEGIVTRIQLWMLH